MDLLLKRRQMLSIEKGPEGGRLSDYVQDGLVFHLDGIKKLDSDGKWHSLVGNFVFTNYGATFNSDHVWFDGEDDYLVRTTTSNIQSSSSGTIEVVYDSPVQAFGSIMRTSANGQVCYGSYSSGTKVIWTTGNPMRAVYTNPPIKGTVSLCIAQGIANGQAMGKSGTNYFTRISGGVFIGRNGASGTSPFSGKIYSIRMYNRNLTVEEVLQNQSVDNIRFNLNLNLA